MKRRGHKKERPKERKGEIGETQKRERENIYMYTYSGGDERLLAWTVIHSRNKQSFGLSR